MADRVEKHSLTHGAEQTHLAGAIQEIHAARAVAPTSKPSSTTEAPKELVMTNVFASVSGTLQEPNSGTAEDMRSNYFLRNPFGTSSAPSQFGGLESLQAPQRQPLPTAFDPAQGPELAAIKRGNTASIIEQ